MDYSIFIYCLVFIIGLILGSFINVLIIRTKEGADFIKGRSHCPKCGTTLKFFDLIPLVSFIFLRGKCRYCTRAISWQYPLVEFATAVLFLLSYVYFSHSAFALASSLVFCSLAVIIFVYDWRWNIIPDKFSITGIIMILALNLLAGIPVWTLLLGAAIAGGFFLFQFAISRGRWIGGGDIRLGALMGVMLGWEKTLLALLLGYVFGAIISLILVALKKKKATSHIAFGTFLAVSAIISLFWGDAIISWYLGLIL